MKLFYPVPLVTLALLASLSSFASVEWAGSGSSDDGESPELLFTAKGSAEAVMTFSHWVLLAAKRTPSESQARAQIEKQVEHLFGPMAVARFPGVPKNNEKLTAIRVTPLTPGVYKIHYNYSGTIDVATGASGGYSVILPNNPDTIYAAGTVKRGFSTTYPCTDDHYQSEGDFWYFWNPYKKGCPLKEHTDFETVKVELKFTKASEKESYPEYSRLVDTDGKIRVSILMGMDDPSNEKDPLKSRDLNAEIYRGIRQALISTGYTSRKMTDAEIRSVIPKGTNPFPHVEELEKRDRHGTILVKMFFGPSGIDERSRAFHYYLKDALENSAIMIYDGHSGLGGHLDIESIEKTEGFQLRASKKKYQIYFFNSCTSYTYYTTMFFNEKKGPGDPKGTKNLDIISNGLETAFGVKGDLILMKAIDAWAKDGTEMSYKKIIRQIDDRNLTSVSGDEDNPKN